MTIEDLASVGTAIDQIGSPMLVQPMTEEQLHGAYGILYQ